MRGDFPINGRPPAPTFANPFPDPFYRLPGNTVQTPIDVSAGQWAPALPWLVFIQLDKEARSLTRGEATTLYHTLGRALDIEK